MRKISFVVCYYDGNRKKFCKYIGKNFDEVWEKVTAEYGDKLISIIWQSSSTRLPEKIQSKGEKSCPHSEK